MLLVVEALSRRARAGRIRVPEQQQHSGQLYQMLCDRTRSMMFMAAARAG